MMDPVTLENLIALFLAARDQLLDTIIYYQGVGTKVYANTILLQLEKQLKQLEKQSSVFASTAIPKEYRKALDDVYAYFQKNNLQMLPPAVFAQIHDDAIYAVAREMQYQIGQGLEQAGRQVLRYVEAARDNALRTAGLTATGEKLASGSTVAQMKQNLIGMLQDQGFMSVKYGSGKNAYQVSLDSYAGMVARSTTREAGNLARINQLSANGYDLVKLTEHYPTCDLCAKFQGRVYSVSGTDKRFPPLEMAFRYGYKNIHPNCRHVAAPWIESMQSPEELQEALDKSNAPFEDTRSDSERALYSKQQGENRQLRQDRYQYERYKARLGTDAPKGFHSFRRMKIEGGDAWGLLEAKYRGMGYYDKAVRLEPEISKVVTGVANSAGMNLAGYDARIKSKDSYLRKIASNFRPGGTEYEVKDILRYTYTAKPASFTDKALLSIDTYAQKGYNTTVVKNSWIDAANPYKGINTFIKSPSGQTFELQYHTPESFALKNGRLHELYEKQRLISDVTSPEYIRLRDEMFDLSDSLTRPDKIEEIRNR